MHVAAEQTASVVTLARTEELVRATIASVVGAVPANKVRLRQHQVLVAPRKPIKSVAVATSANAAVLARLSPEPVLADRTALVAHVVPENRRSVAAETIANVVKDARPAKARIVLVDQTVLVAAAVRAKRRNAAAATIASVAMLVRLVPNANVDLTVPAADAVPASNSLVSE